MQCLVTGSSGYLGRALLPGLLAQGARVIAHCHRGEVARDLSDDLRGDPRGELRVERGDLVTDMPTLRDVHTVFHLAGIAHQQAAPDAYQQVNVHASLRLARAALDAGVRRFIFLSSVKAASVQDFPGIDGARGVKPEPTKVCSYAHSKALAEIALRELCVNSPMELTVIRPALIYSADAPGHLALLRRWVALRLPPPPPGGGRSMIARDDLVRLLLQLGAAPGRVPELITATDGESYSTQRLHRALCRHSQRRPLAPELPRGMWALACVLADRLRGEPRGTHWQRLAGDDVHASEGLDILAFEAQLTFERSLGIPS